MDKWLDGFRRDMHPDEEVRVWERIAAAYLEYCTFVSPSVEQRKLVFDAILSLSLGSRSKFEKTVEGLPSDAGKIILACYRSDGPFIELKGSALNFEPSPIAEPAHIRTIVELPEHLIDELHRRSKADADG